MALELQYLGQNVSLFGPDMELTGDPALDNAALEKAGYLAGTPVALKTSTTNPDAVCIAPADGNADTVFGLIITEPGEFANTIGPAGSNRIAVARAHFIGNVYSGSQDQTTRAYVTLSATNKYEFGCKLYCTAGTNKGKVTSNPTNAQDGNTAALTQVIGICTHTPTTTEPWLGFASLV